MLLLTWHDSSAPTKEPFCDSVTLRSLPQHDSSTPCKDSVCESITPRCMPYCMLTPPTDEFVIKYTQLSGVQEVDTQNHVIEDVIRQLPFEETKLDGEAGFNDVARSAGEHVKHGNGQEDESAPGTDDDDDDDDADFLVDKENENVEPDVDVHLFDIIMYVPFDNIGVTNLVQDDILEGDNVDVIDA
ncbi:hypothetical protein Tco_1554352 [Tanacetum coccineum]